MHQHGFGLVLRVVRREQHLIVAQQPFGGGVAQRPRLRLKAPAAPVAHADLLGVQRDVQFAAQGHAAFTPAIGVRVQAVVHVQGRDAGRQGRVDGGEGVQQGRGIGPAAQRDPQPARGGELIQ